MDKLAKWYDSDWLNVYYAAKDVIAEVAPSRLQDFVRSFDILRTDFGFETRAVPDLLDRDELAFIQSIIAALPMTRLKVHEMKDFGRFVVHDIPEFTAIQNSLEERASEWAGEPLKSSYNFLSLYTKMGECKPHLDSPSAKWTLDLCIGQSATWPIYLGKVIPWPEGDARLADDYMANIKTDPTLGFQAHILTPGDAVFFSGSSQWHYRDAMPTDQKNHFCDLLFMHFIPQGAVEIVQPKNWPALFDVPELALVNRINDAL